jgi:siderophore synthetase component
MMPTQSLYNLFNDKEEKRIESYLSEKHPELAASYRAFLSKGRQGILRRLVGSLLREDVLGLQSRSCDLHVIDTIFVLNAPALETWRPALQILNRYGLKDGQSYKLIPLSKGDVLVVPVSRPYAFRRFEVEGGILHLSESGVREVEHAVEVLELLAKEEADTQGDGEHIWERLAEELCNGSANLAFAYAYDEQRRAELRALAKKHQAKDTLTLVKALKQRDPAFDASLFFEQLIVEGHNLHPCAKTKIGMEPDAVLRYAPEFQGAPEIRFAGIRLDHAEWAVTGPKPHPNALLFAEYPELETAARSELSAKGLSLSDYLLVPVHPWQMEHQIPKIYAGEIEANIVIMLTTFAVSARATSSFRTVVPKREDGKAKLAIKVAVNSQMTSTVRSISANTTNNAPRFTELIRSVMERESALCQTFVPVNELAGYNFKSESTIKSRNLSAVLRENVESFVSGDELAIVGSALYAESPVTGKIVLVELIEAYADATEEPSLAKAAKHFLTDYASIALPGFLTLMVRYGIGLEGHLQNSVPVFQNGRPVRMLFRDWGGARIYGERLQRQGLDVSFYPGSMTITDSLSEMRNKVFYTVFQNHFAELILQICKHIGAAEQELWAIIRKICDQVLTALAQDASIREDALSDRAALYQKQVDHKALTKMRLVKEEKGYCYATVSNPLAEE